jgi:hypothetical protein
VLGKAVVCDCLPGAAGSFYTTPGSYWVNDADIRCYRGKHLTFAVVYGLPWLVIFCLGVPIYTAMVLYR